MTFPRRLTPSDKERATIVQQRMTPGGALGVGSRHVRQGDRPAGNSTSSAGGIIGRADYTSTTLGSIGGTGAVGSGPLALVESFGDDSSIGPSTVTYGLAYLDVGWYQVSARVDVDSAVAGDVLRLAIFTGGSEIYRTSAVALAAGVASLAVCSPPLYRDPADGDSVSFSISNEANRGTISVNNTLTLVRFAG